MVLSTDADAARVLIQLAGKIVNLNPALKSRLRVDRWRVTNIVTGSEIEVMSSSDAASFYGQLPDAIIARRDYPLAVRVPLGIAGIDAAEKKHLLLVILSNAGWLDSWQRRVFESLLEVPHALVDVMSGTAAVGQQRATRGSAAVAASHQRIKDSGRINGWPAVATC